LRAYVTEDGVTSYGKTIEFNTLTGTPTGTWFHYDDGFNYDGIGLTEGGSFDLAIRIPSSDLQNYDGFYVSKIKFYVKVGSPTAINVTLWEGSVEPELVYDEEVLNYNVEAWTEYTPTQQYVINSNIELWVGLWVQNHLADTYPAGVDDGPAVTGKGDMMSFDDGGEWVTLSSMSLDYNWNIQVYITNYKGQEKQLIISDPEKREHKFKSIQNGSGNRIASEKQNSKLDR